MLISYRYLLLIFYGFVDEKLQEIAFWTFTFYHLLGPGITSFQKYKKQKFWLDVHLTAVFFETGAMSTPTKSQNVTNCGSGGSFQS